MLHDESLFTPWGEVTFFTNTVLQGFLSWGGQDGSKMIVAYESTLTHAGLLGGV